MYDENTSIYNTIKTYSSEFDPKFEDQHKIIHRLQFFYIVRSVYRTVYSIDFKSKKVGHNEPNFLREYRHLHAAIN